MHFDAFVPFIMGSVGGVCINFFFIVTCLKVPPDKLDFRQYSFVVPVGFSLWNLIGYTVEHYTQQKGIRWLVTTGVGFAVNLLLGKSSGYAENYPGSLYYAYAFGS